MLQKKIIDLLRNGIVMDVGIEYPNDNVIPIPTLYHGKFVGVSPSGRYILISTQWREVHSRKKKTIEKENVIHIVLDVEKERLRDTLKDVYKLEKISTRTDRKSTTTQVLTGVGEPWKRIVKEHVRDQDKTFIVEVDAEDPTKKFKLVAKVEKVLETTPVEFERLTIEEEVGGRNKKSTLKKTFNMVKNVESSFPYTKAPFVQISAPTKKPDDSIQAVVTCTLSRDGTLHCHVVNPGLYQRDEVEIEATFIPHACDVDKFPTKISIYPYYPYVDQGFSPLNREVTDAYDIDVTIKPPSQPYPRKKLYIHTIGWFSDIKKYTHSSLPFMLDYTFKIASEMNVDQIVLDDQSYIPTKGIRRQDLPNFNLNPMQQLYTGSKHTKLPKIKYHPPFNKVLLSLTKGFTYYTQQGFLCLPVLFFNRVDQLIDQNPSCLQKMVDIMKVFSETAGTLIHSFAGNLKLGDVGMEISDSSTYSSPLPGSKKRSAVSSPEVMDHPKKRRKYQQTLKPTTTVKQAAAQFTTSFKKRMKPTDPDVDVDMMNFYNEFSRKLFTYYKHFVRNIKGTEMDLFKEYIGILLPFIQIIQSVGGPVTPDNFLDLLPHITPMTMDQKQIKQVKQITQGLSVPQQLHSLRILLWSYNSTFSSTRMYPNAQPPYFSRTIRKKRQQEGGGGGGRI